MTLRSLEIFVAVVKHGKMSEASNELHISQPTISQAVDQLEKEYGVKLFDRLSKKLYLTDAGRQLLSYAQSILALASEMEKSMASLSVHKTIQLGGTITVGKCVLVDIVKEFEALYPNVKIHVTIDNTQTIEHLLLHSQLDLALVEGIVKSKELIAASAIDDKLVLVSHPTHELAKQKLVCINELESQPFVLREQGSGTREAFEKELERHGVAIEVKWNCHGYDSILEAVQANQGLTVISEKIVKPYVEDKKLKVITLQDAEGNNVKLNRNFSLVYHKTKIISGSLNNLIELILKA